MRHMPRVKRFPRRTAADRDFVSIQRLMAKDLDDWEQKRVKRFKGENDGVL